MPSLNLKRIYLYQFIFLCCLLHVLSGCSKKTPINIGFVGTEEGFNGALLAVEMANNDGGIRGHMIKVVAIDPGQEGASQAETLSSLSTSDTLAIIDSSSNWIVPTDVMPPNSMIIRTATRNTETAAQKNKTVVISSPFETMAPALADLMWKNKLYSVSMIVDMNDPGYNGKWLTSFRATYEGHRGVVLKIEKIVPGKKRPLADIVKTAVVREAAGLVIIANPETTVEICKLVRENNSRVRFAVAETAVTSSRVTEIPELEGALAVNFMERGAALDSFAEFSKAFSNKFGTTPGLSSASAFDAANLVITSLRDRKSKKDLLAAAVKIPSMKGSMGTLKNNSATFNRDIALTRIIGGNFVDINDKG